MQHAHIHMAATAPIAVVAISLLCANMSNIMSKAVCRTMQP